MIWTDELRSVLPGRTTTATTHCFRHALSPTQTQSPRRWLMVLMPTRLPRVLVLDYRTRAAANDQTRVRNE
jgi:hypothetical protein